MDLTTAPAANVGDVLVTFVILGAVAGAVSAAYWAADRWDLAGMARQLTDDVLDLVDELRAARAARRKAELDELVAWHLEQGAIAVARRQIRSINHPAGTRRPAA